MGKNLILWMLFSFCLFCNAQTPNLKQTAGLNNVEDKQREYDKTHPTSLSNIKRSVGHEFEEWAQKGVLEKTSEWNDRILRYGPQIFDSLCYETITKLVWQNLLMQENGYDADSEKLKSNVYYKFASKMIAGYVDFPRDKYIIVLNNNPKPQVVKIINVAVIDNCVWPQKEKLIYDRIGELDRAYPINPTNLEIQFKDLILTNSGLKTMLGEYTFEWNSIIAEQFPGMYHDHQIVEPSGTEAQRKAEAEVRAKAEAEARARANFNSRVQGAFGRGNHPENSGSTQGQGVQSSRTVKMLQKPKYSDRKSEGTVVVAVTIDTQGNVVNAKIVNATTTSSKLRDSAISAALASKFSAGTTIEPGTITYVFKQI